MTGQYVRPEKKPPKIEKLVCPQCGGSITLRAKGYTQTLVCPYCLTNLDVSRTNLRIKELNKQTYAVPPLIPLGTRGKLHGVTWEVIGFMQKRGVYGAPNLPIVDPVKHGWQTHLVGWVIDADVDDDAAPAGPPPPITWQEYLLFNPLKGFRWLSERNGHWNYIITLHDFPQKEFWGQNYKYLDATYRMYEAYEGTVLFVIGEFYWRIKVGDYAILTDYLNKESILTREQLFGERPATVSKTHAVDNSILMGDSHYGSAEIRETPIQRPATSDQEEIWSLAEYIDAEEIQTAFNLEHPLPSRIGVALNQPLTHRDMIQTAYKFSAVGVAALLVLQVMFGLLNYPKTLYQAQLIATKPLLSTLTPTEDTSNTLVSPSFTIDAKSGVMQLQVQSNVHQSWIEADVNLIQDATGKHINLQTGLEYYSGYDSDGYWSEGKKSDTWTFSVPEKGQYHLVINTDTNEEAIPVKVILSQGHISFNNFLFALILIVLPAAVGFIYSVFFESRREQ